MTDRHSPPLDREGAATWKATRTANLAARVFAGALMLGGPLAHAQEFYAGRSIDLIVANTTGGGYDQYARHLARHMSRHIPGQPSIIVKNMPGAGGGRAANFLANVAPKDGTVLALLTREIGLAPAPDSEPRQLSVRRNSLQLDWYAPAGLGPVHHQFQVTCPVHRGDENEADHGQRHWAWVWSDGVPTRSE